jgi:hypothetical protein
MGGVMRQAKPRPLRVLAMALVFGLLQGACGGGDGADDTLPPANLTGEAILELQLVDGGRNSTPRTPPAGFRLLDIDLNQGTGGNYVWLYYRTGRADGSEGQPVTQIYTVDQHDGETPQGGMKLPVDLNAGSPFVGGRPLWLYVVKASRPVARCVVVDNRTKSKRVYGPPEAAGKGQIEWVRQLSANGLSPPYPDLPRDAQDLNEGESYLLVISDYIYIGYCKD